MSIPCPPQRRKPDFTLTMINIVFLLLLFFLTTGSLTNRNEAQADIPFTKDLPLERLPRPLLLITADGEPVPRRQALTRATLIGAMPRRHWRIPVTLDAALNLLAQREMAARDFLDIARAAYRGHRGTDRDAPPGRRAGWGCAVRGPSQAGLWTLALAGSLVLHGAAAIALAAIPGRQDKPAPADSDRLRDAARRQAAGVSPAEIVAPAAPEPVAAASPEVEALAPAETAAVPVAAADATLPAQSVSEAPDTAASQDVAALQPVEDRSCSERERGLGHPPACRGRGALPRQGATPQCALPGQGEAKPSTPSSGRRLPPPRSRGRARGCRARRGSRHRRGRCPRACPVPIAEDTAPAAAALEPAPAVAPIDAADAPVAAATVDGLAPTAGEDRDSTVARCP